MSPRVKLTLACVGSFVAGAAVVGGLAREVMQREARYAFAGVAYGNAARAQTSVRQLISLRAGDTPRVISELDTMLDGYTMQLASYEEVVPAGLRDPFVYKSLAEVRRYRESYPLHIENPTVRAEYQRALDLGKKANVRGVM